MDKELDKKGVTLPIDFDVRSVIFDAMFNSEAMKERNKLLDRDIFECIVKSHIKHQSKYDEQV